MRGKQIAKTKYNNKGYWLVFYTDFMQGHNFSPEIFHNPFDNDIQVILEDSEGNNLGDAISHFGSYGVEYGEWEIMIDTLSKNWGDEVMGNLTWKEVEKYFDKKIRKLENAKLKEHNEIKTKP